jgi:predicted cation transporter
MVAKQWQWDSMFMFRTFGWKAVLGTVTNAALAAWVLRKELQKIKVGKPQKHDRVPIWLTGIHILFLILIVMTAHYAVIFIGLFLFFMGMTWTTREYQDDLKLREGLLVGFFLAGLVVLGGLQNWWLAPLIQKMSDLPLFLGATALTAITDNAALTFLGSQVEGVSETFKYALVAGAVSGGGLTVIANAPNPAGFAILRDCFGSDGISPPKLFAAAAIPTLIVMGYFWLV